MISFVLRNICGVVGASVILGVLLILASCLIGRIVDAIHNAVEKSKKKVYRIKYLDVFKIDRVVVSKYSGHEDFLAKCGQKHEEFIHARNYDEAVADFLNRHSTSNKLFLSIEKV